MKYEWDRAKGHVFRVPRRHEKAVRALSKADIRSILKDGIYFATDTLSRLGAAVETADAEYHLKSRAIIDELMESAKEYLPLLEASAAVLAELDAFASMSFMVSGLAGSWVRPVMSAGGEGDVVVIGERERVCMYFCM